MKVKNALLKIDQEIFLLIVGLVCLGLSCIDNNAAENVAMFGVCRYYTFYATIAASLVMAIIVTQIDGQIIWRRELKILLPFLIPAVVGSIAKFILGIEPIFWITAVFFFYLIAKFIANINPYKTERIIFRSYIRLRNAGKKFKIKFPPS